jgi:hypothetical protein
MASMKEQWEQILAHLKRLRSEKDAPEHHKRRHSKHGASPVIRAYARNEMKRRQCHKG